MLPNKIFYYLRHGQTDWNREQKAMGQADVPLNSTGVTQARIAATMLVNEKIARICYSPLTRARQTAEIIADILALPTMPVPDLQQCNWGAMQGQERGDDAWRRAWIAGEAIEGAETFESFRRRILQGLAEALSQPGPVLIVAHGATYGAVQYALNLPNAEISNCHPIIHRPLANQPQTWDIFTLD